MTGIDSYVAMLMLAVALGMTIGSLLSERW
nr:MAG TPA: protein of unknown function (DUF883) [Caudoviricetes sp.]